jgi:hypothetical protein
MPANSSKLLSGPGSSQPDRRREQSADAHLECDLSWRVCGQYTEQETVVGDDGQAFVYWLARSGSSAASWSSAAPYPPSRSTWR